MNSKHEVEDPTQASALFVTEPFDGQPLPTLDDDRLPHSIADRPGFKS